MDLAPDAQISQVARFDEQLSEVVDQSWKMMSIPGIVRVGPSLTLRFDHAYTVQFLGHNVQTLVGLGGSARVQ